MADANRPSFDVYGMGNALVDFEYQVSARFLEDNGVARGHTTLVNDARMAEIVEALEGRDSHRASGGSAANTAYAVRAFGGSSFYCCRVADDDDGRFFLADLAAAGVAVRDGDWPDGTTGRCVAMVTPDAERSMFTMLAISETLNPDDVDHAALARSRCLHIEGYLCSSPSARAAVLEARETARAEGVATSLVLSDPAMVANFRAGLEEMLGNGVDQLFCNEEEALTWAGTDRLDIAGRELADIAPRVNITLGARGSLAISPHQRALVEGFPAQALDTTGAGDMYAGACLFALGNGAEPRAAARFANFAAADVVGRFGARLRASGDYLGLRRRYARGAPG